MSYTKNSIAGHVRYVSQYKNLKSKVLKCADIYFNRQCLKQTLIPSYTKIKIPNTSSVSTFSTKLSIFYGIFP